MGSIQITFKTPDAGEQEINDWARARVDQMLTDREDAYGQRLDPATISKEEINEMFKIEVKEAKKWISKWVKYGEYVTLEFNLFQTGALLIPKAPTVLIV